MSGQPFTPKNVLLVGGTGWIGSAIAEELSQRKEFNVKILVRKESKETKKDRIQKYESAGATIVEGDINDPASLSAALQDVDTVISVLGGHSVIVGDQSKLLQAAKEAGSVKLFVPSEWGIDSFESDPFPLFDAQAKLRKEVQESGLQWTFIVTGLLYQYFYTPRARFDPQNGHAIIPGDGSGRFNTIDVKDVGKYVPEILLDPETKNKTIHISGANLSYNEAVKIFEEALGKKFDVKYVSLEEEQKTYETSSKDFMLLLITRISIRHYTSKQDEPNYGAKYKHIHPLSLADYAKSLI